MIEKNSVISSFYLAFGRIKRGVIYLQQSTTATSVLLLKKNKK